jgi:hypothetical protein
MAFVVQPGAGARAGFDDTFNPNCPAATALPTNTGQVLTFTGTLTCFRPGGPTRFGTNVAPQNVQVREAQPQVGDPCQNIDYHPVTFSEDTGGNPAAHFAIFGSASEGTLPLTADDAAMMGTHDAFVSDTQLGTYQLTNPADPTSLACQLNPTFHFFCPATGVVGPPVCYTWVLHPLAPAVPDPVSLKPFFGDEIGQLQAQAGVVGSAPAQRAVVNTPTCFWIDSMGIQNERDLTLVLAGPPDVSGRQIFYTFFARIVFQGVSWVFDTTTGDTSQVAVPSQCPVHPQEVAHQYTRISDGLPGGKYEVSATENYSISVTVYWIDSAGAHGPVPVDPGVAAPQLTPGHLFQYVGQIEGVPLSGQ